MNNRKRPVNLDLTTIQFPVPAIASILHRISGVILFFCIPLLLWALQSSLDSLDSFNALYACVMSGVGKFVLWAILTALLYHLLAGIRHLLMDTGIGETLKSGRLGAKLVIGVSIFLSLSIGVWLW